MVFQPMGSYMAFIYTYMLQVVVTVIVRSPEPLSVATGLERDLTHGVPQSTSSHNPTVG